ncbi:MAG TPA: sulfate adenylyltransferase subunit CysN [Alphaproteobacteria bacterium]
MGVVAPGTGKELLRFMTCGSVDDGKSTLIGRLLFDSGVLSDDQLAQLRADSRNRVVSPEGVDVSLLVDGLMAEREQNITIDVAYRFFETPRRRFIVADTPGHEQYTRNMATGASRAELAVLLVDARKGLLSQTRRHAFIAALMGIRQAILAVNKMDLVGFDTATFDRIASEFADFAAKIGLSSVRAIPVSALRGDTVFRRSADMPWYEGPTLLEALEAAALTPAAETPFRMPVQYVIRAQPDFRGYAGLVVGGRVAVGDEVTISPGGRKSRVARLSTFDGDVPAVERGRSVTLCLADDIDVSRGDVLAAVDQAPTVSEQFAARLVWMDEEPLYHGRSYTLQLGATRVNATVTEIRHRIEVDTLGERPAKSLALNDIAVVKVALDRPIALDAYAANRDTGSFILIDRMTHRTAGAGMILHSLYRGQNLAWQHFEVDHAQRTALKGQKAAILWFTGLSGAGKSTIANLVERKLTADGRHCYILDGDNVRHGLNRDLGFTVADRVENIRRVAEVARLMADAGLIVIVSLISPFIRERAMAREIAGDIDFMEVFVDTPVEICEQRDPKGLYRKARAGAIANFTGINAPYERPETPDVVLTTTGDPPEMLADRLVGELHSRGVV